MRIASTTHMIPDLDLPDRSKMLIMTFGIGIAWFKDSLNDPFSQECMDMIKTAIKLGYRHFDTAEIYGTEESQSRKAVFPEKVFFITTKVLDSIEDIPLAIENSLRKLGMEYVDLYQIHSPYFTVSNPSVSPSLQLHNAWSAMENVQRSGKTRFIGVSNFLRPHITAILETCTIKPLVNQIEYHPYLQRAGGYVPWLQEQGIIVQGFMGLVPITNGEARRGPLLGVKDEYGDSLLEKLAKKYKVDTSAVLIRWGLQKGAASISTSKGPGDETLKAYLMALEFVLEEEEVREISRVGETWHFRNRLQDVFEKGDKS